MKCTTAMNIFAAAFVVCLAFHAAWAAPQQIEEQNEDEGGRGWQTLSAVRNWFSPVTNYFREEFPEKKPGEFATDIREAAVDLTNSAQEHPVGQVVTRVIKPVGQWIKDTATDLNNRSFGDIYRGAVSSFQNADERIASWINSGDDTKSAQILE